jgi:hypothetical protein
VADGGAVVRDGGAVLSSYLDQPGGERETWGVVAYALAFWVFAAHNPLRWALAGLAAAQLGIVLDSAPSWPPSTYPNPPDSSTSPHRRRLTTKPTSQL